MHLGAVFLLASMLSKPEIERMEFRLRPYVPDDFERLWDLDQRCFEVGISYSRTELRHYIELKTAFTVIAEDGGSQLRGFLIGQRRRGGYGHVLTIDVEPEFRQHGVGTLLLRDAHNRLAGYGCHIVFLEAAVNNVAAIAFYKRHGYSVVRTLPRYYHVTGVDAFLLSRSLQPHDVTTANNTRS